MLLELEIQSVAYGGSGVAKKDGFVYFVPGVLPGELVLAEETSRKKNFGTARPVEIPRTSQKRIPSGCPLSLQPAGSRFAPGHYCPGCAYQCSAYEEEISFKQAQLRDFLSRTCGINPEELLQAPVPSPLPLGYRNKIVLHSDGKTMGYFAEDNRTLLKVDRCQLAHDEINEKLAFLQQNTIFMRGAFPGMELSLRRSSRGKSYFWFGHGPPPRNRMLREKTAAGELLVPIASFFQINIHVADLMLHKIMDIIRKTKPSFVCDLYCGCGLFSFAAAAAGVTRTAGADSDAGSIKAAAANAKRMGFKDMRFVAGDAGRLLPQLMRGADPAGTMLIVDPPRAGLRDEALSAVADSGAASLLYVSCAPDTMARDVKTLIKSGYRPAEIMLFDMFPRTARFETLAELRRINIR